jgi:polyisoprenoid-binding protein YceI
MTATTGTALRAGRWQIVSSLSCAGLAVRNFGVKTVQGRIPVLDAWVDVDASGRPTAVHATLDLAGIDTGNTRRDRDLRAPRLLDTAKYPTVTFDGAAPKQVGVEEWTVAGRLAARATSVEVTLQVRVTSAAEGQIGIHAVTELDRRDLGVTAPRFLIGRRVAICVDAAFTAPR